MCYSPKRLPPASFYILSKGNNAGRPAYTPNPNCFGFYCPPEDTPRYYWLVYALWRTQHFAYYLRGSVIPFIIIGDVRSCIAAHHLAEETLKPLTGQIEALAALERNLKAQIALLSQIRQTVLKKALTAPPCPRPDPLGEDPTQIIFSPLNTNEDEDTTKKVRCQCCPATR